MAFVLRAITHDGGSLWFDSDGDVRAAHVWCSETLERRFPLAPFDGPAVLAARLAAAPGVIGHGLSGPSLVSQILIGRGDAAGQLHPR